MFTKKLSELLGWEGPTIIIGWYLLTVVLIRVVSPSFGRLVAWEQKLEGEYRKIHSSIVTQSEEIAFYQGQDWEEALLQNKFTELLKHQTLIMYKKLYMAIFDSMLVKYGAAICGYSVVGIPVFSNASKSYLASINNNQSQVK